MIDPKMVEALKKEFSDVPPMIFHRSVEHAENAGHLFDILSKIPEFPLIWSWTEKRWITTRKGYIDERISIND